MGTSGAMALTRGTGDAAFTRRTCASIATLAVLALGIAAALTHVWAPGVSGTAAALQLSSASPADLQVSQRLGAQDRRFWAIRTPAGALTRNPGQHVSAAFTPAGVQVDVPGGHLGLSLVGFGRAGHLASVVAPGFHASGNRVA